MKSVAFGDLEQGVWGAAWVPEYDQPGFACVGVNGDVHLQPGELIGDGESPEWRLGDLTISPAAELVPTTAEDGFDQLCRVHGNVAGHEISCLGRRAIRQVPELGRYDSIREISLWSEPAEGVALVALRPRKAKGQESDLLTAAVLDAGATSPVAEPRLSTTYAADGTPTRAGVELWLGADDEEELYPRRAAGEAAGAHASGACGAFHVLCELFRWHSRGRDGTGIYLLARAQ